MSSAPKPYFRKSPRAKFHDYSGGVYFVTICTDSMKYDFGRIENATMHFTDLGKQCFSSLSDLERHYSYIEVPVFTVMPNHIHAIICINNNTPLTINPEEQKLMPAKRSALSVIVGVFKSGITTYARRNNIDFDWQTRYHDRIIRSQFEANRIAEYIENNVARWDKDCFNV